MLLLEQHPEVATRDCNHCQLYNYNEETGQVQMRGGVPVRRPIGTVAPCRSRRSSCPKGTPENSKALTEKNTLALEHYEECDAVGQFPDDPIVRENARIIKTIRRAISRAEARLIAQRMSLLASLTSTGKPNA